MMAAYRANVNEGKFLDGNFYLEGSARLLRGSFGVDGKEGAQHDVPVLSAHHSQRGRD